MGVSRPGIAMAFAAGVCVLGQPAAAGDDDVPKRQPVLVWEVAVECDSDAALAAAGGRGHRCELEFARDLAFVHEHPGTAGGDGPFRLTAFDVATGALLWSVDVGESYEIRVTDDAVVLSDKSHIEVFDAETGTRRFMRGGDIIDVNDYGVLIMRDGTDSIVAIDAADGDELWSMRGRVGAMCRDFVAVVPTPSQPAAPFALVDHRTGQIRWESDVAYEPLTGHMACSAAPWLYVTDGSRLYELDSLDGWTTWETLIPEAGVIDLYREVALVHTGPAGDMITAVRREDGVVLWQATATSVGASLSWAGRLREDANGVFTLHPLTGQAVQRVDLAGASGTTPWDVVGVSDTRVVVAVAGVITAYGMNDLGMAWQLDVGVAPDDFGVTDGYLVVRAGAMLRGYAAQPRATS